jgi:F-type H+-transporting ATPase subunit delta
MPDRTDEVARVYAESLLELAEKVGANGIAEVGEEMAALAAIAREDRTFAEFLRSPVIDATSREASLRRMLDGRASPLVRDFILVLNRKGRLGEFANIAVAYDALVQERLGRVEVDVWTASGPVGEDLLASLRAKVREATGKDPVFRMHVDPSMIGGIRLRIGDRLLDGSVATRLAGLREHLIASGRGDLRADPDRFLSTT